MKLRLEATAEELHTKGSSLVKALVEELHDFDPQLAHSLEKALPPKEVELKYRAMRELAAESTAAYQRTIDATLKEIRKVIDAPAKPLVKSITYYGDLTLEQLVDRAREEGMEAHIQLVKAEDEEGEEPLEPGDVNPETGDVEPEPLTPEEEEEKKEEKELNKAGPFIGPKGGKWKDAKHTIPWKPEKPKYVSTFTMPDGKVMTEGPGTRKYTHVALTKYRGRTEASFHTSEANAQKRVNRVLKGIKVGKAEGRVAKATVTKVGAKPKAKAKKPVQMSLLNIVGNEPTLSAKQKQMEKSEALKAVMANPKSDPKQWKLPAGARVNDPWEPKEAKPTDKWKHPDFGEGKGQAPWQVRDWAPELKDYDKIVVNSSAGKDSQAMLTHVVDLAKAQGYPMDQIVVVHADLGRAEWEGTKELARDQAKAYGLRFEVVQRQQNDLIEQIEERHGDLTQRQTDVAKLAANGIRTWKDLSDAGQDAVVAAIGAEQGSSKWEGAHRANALIRKAEKIVAKPTEKKGPDSPVDFGKAIAWPSSDARYCTSDHKRAEVKKLLTQLADEHREKHGAKTKPKILNALGIRAQESTSRENMDNFNREEDTGRRTVDRWYPIHQWHEEKVWKTIEKSGLPHHKAYDLGMRRLSCVFCVFATKEDLMVAATHNPNLFNTYLELEEKVGSKFKSNESLADVRDEIAKRRAEGLGLNEQAEWVKKSLDIDMDLDLVKAAIAGDSPLQPTLVGPVLEAALVRLTKAGEAIRTVSMEWKVSGACVHLETPTESHHVEYLAYPGAYNASLIVGAFAQRNGLELIEHNEPPPLDLESLEKSGPHKYKSKKRVKGKWVYEYDEPKGRKKGDDSAPLPGQRGLFDPNKVVVGKPQQGSLFAAPPKKAKPKKADDNAPLPGQIGLFDDTTPTQDDLFAEAKDHGINLPAYFPSGSNHEGEILGFASLGMNVGVAVDKLDAQGNAERALKDLAGKGTKVFVDSGAFGEMKENFPKKDKGPETRPYPDHPIGLIVDPKEGPITDAEWIKRLATYDRLATDLGSQLYAVGPDMVANQDVTLERMKRYAPQVKAIRDKGAHMMMPIQKGKLSMAAMDDRITSIMGEGDYIRAIPMKKDATSVEDLKGFLTDKKIDRIHLLGLGEKSSKYPEVMAMLKEHSPHTKVTLDSVAITAGVERPQGKEPRGLTAAQDRVRADLGPRIFNEAIAGLDYTDNIATPSAWAPASILAWGANELGLTGDDLKQFKSAKKVDDWLQEDSRYERLDVEHVLDRMWVRWTVGELGPGTDGRIKLLGGKGLTVERKKRGIRELTKPGIDMAKAEDHTFVIAQADERAYRRVRRELGRYGYSADDFDSEGGRLYGQSVNQLIDLVKEIRC